MHKRLVLILAGLSAMLIVRSAMAAVSVYCDGSVCGGTSPAPVDRDYLYEAVVSSGSINLLEVGTCDGDAEEYTNWVVELKTDSGWTDVTSQWTASINDANSVFWQHSNFTPHGSISTPDGLCPAVIEWSQNNGATVGADFLFGFDNPWSPHDATWYAGPDLGSADWSQAIGMGAGPIHSPMPEPGSLALLAGAGFGLFLRRR